MNDKTTDNELEVMVGDSTMLAADLIDEDGTLKTRILLGNGVCLLPRFTSIRTAGAIGTNEVLSFAIELPIGLVTHLAAMAIYDWSKERGVRRLRTNRAEVPLTGSPEERVQAIGDLLKMTSTDTPSDELR